MLQSLLLLQALQHATPRRKSSGSTQIDPATLLLLASTLQGGGKRGETTIPERTRLRKMTLRGFCRSHYLPERHHAPTGPTASLTDEFLSRSLACFGRELLLRELTAGTLRELRTWFSSQIEKGMSPATANLRLRQLRAIWNHAAKRRYLDSGRPWRPVKPPPPIEFFPEEDPEINAWTPEQLDALDRQALAQVGTVGGVDAAVFWVAFERVFRSMGSRVTATMLVRREDYDCTSRAIWLRKENQKQKRDQRIALPPGTAAAVERLLAAHSCETIFGCWPFDPPLRKTGRRKWKVLTKHFEQRLVKPAGLTLQKGVKTRQFRRTAATIVEENGGNAQELLGHRDRKTTDRYKDPKRRPICRQSLLIPDSPPPQLTLF
jgi:integrase